MAEIARDLVDAGLMKPEDEEEAAKRIEAKLKELAARKRRSDAEADEDSRNTEPLLP